MNCQCGACATHEPGIAPQAPVPTASKQPAPPAVTRKIQVGPDSWLLLPTRGGKGRRVLAPGGGACTFWVDDQGGLRPA